jgi:hypothetical protein
MKGFNKQGIWSCIKIKQFYYLNKKRCKLIQKKDKLNKKWTKSTKATTCVGEIKGWGFLVFFLILSNGTF